MPKPVHVLPCGLTIFESVLKPYNKGETAVIGGPIEAFEGICNSIQSKTLMRHMINLCSSLKSYKPTIDYFPSSTCDAENILEHYSSQSVSLCCSAPCIHEFSKVFAANTEQSELSKFLKLQEAGLDVGYRCAQCRSCKKCKER